MKKFNYTQYPKRSSINFLSTFFIKGMLFVFLLFSFYSCKKFLAAYSQNEAFLQTASDLDELLIGAAYSGETPPVWVHLLDDDTEENPIADASGTPVFFYFGLHHWQPLPFFQSNGTETPGADFYYYELYKKISVINTVIFNVPTLREKGEPADQLQRISGEAHFFRAWYYFILVNIYGKPYASQSAASDYGVPLKTDPAVEDKFFTRSAVKQVYDQIVSDLLEAEKELGGFNQSSTIRAGQEAVRALLSRVYLYMEDYEKTIIYANEVIAKNYRITDLNQFMPANSFLSQASTENILARKLSDLATPSLIPYMQSNNNTFSPDNFQVSTNLVNSFLDNDLRKQVFFERGSEGEFLARKSGNIPEVLDEYLIRLPEVYLNKAEAEAILGRNESAAQTLQELRKNRFAPSDLTNVSEMGVALVNFIREERRRELCFEMHRWFDLRRYGVNSSFRFEKAIRHISHAYNASGRFIQGYYELNPYTQDKAAYVIPLPKKETTFNRGSIVNEERPARPIKQ